MGNITENFLSKEMLNESFEGNMKEVEVLAKEEKDLILNKFNNAYVKYDDEKTIIDLFEEQVEKTPENIAIIFEGEEITYKELNEKSNSLAKILRENGIRDDSVVGMISERSINMIVGILSIIKAGGAYLPIDPEYPEKRINYILEDSQVEVVLLQNKYKEKINIELNIFDLDNIELYGKDTRNLVKISDKNNLIYVIYTSGTTGNPKGVMIENKSLVNYVLYARDNYLNEENIAMPLYTSISFDLTITSIFVPLISGNKIIIYRESDIDKLIKNVFESKENEVVKVTPAHLSLLMDIPNINKKIKKFIVGGEELTAGLAKEVSDRFQNNIEIINEYGPTEGTIGCITHKYDNTKKYNGGVLIGKPMNNFHIYIVNKKNNIVPIGKIGEICISGDGVARGYLNNEKLTKEKFVNNPYEIGRIMYKTGDLARWLPDGNIEYLGRVDDQVKIRGFRIELSEIENAIRNINYVSDVAVIVRENKIGENEINAYIISKDESIIENIKNELNDYLPEYMIPKKIIKIDKLPLTKNGKLDRKELLEIKEIDEKNYAQATNPLEEELIDIWREMLDLEVIGINDNFLELGGHSLIATKMVYRINEVYEIDLSLVEFLTIGLTVKSLAKLIEEKLFDSISDEELELMLKELED